MKWYREKSQAPLFRIKVEQIQNAFVYNRVGYASAIAVILAVAIFVLAFLVVRIGGQQEQ